MSKMLSFVTYFPMRMNKNIIIGLYYQRLIIRMSIANNLVLVGNNLFWIILVCGQFLFRFLFWITSWFDYFILRMPHIKILCKTTLILFRPLIVRIHRVLIDLGSIANTLEYSWISITHASLMTIHTWVNASFVKAFASGTLYSLHIDISVTLVKINISYGV